MKTGDRTGDQRWRGTSGEEHRGVVEEEEIAFPGQLTCGPERTFPVTELVVRLLFHVQELTPWPRSMTQHDAERHVIDIQSRLFFWFWMERIPRTG